MMMSPAPGGGYTSLARRARERLTDDERALLGSRLPILGFSPSPPQERFLQSNHLRRLLRAGNQVGKTCVGAHEAWGHATGIHPYRPMPAPPTIGLVISADWRSYVDVISRAMYQTCPTWLLDKSSDYTESRGWKNRMVSLLNGSTILFRSSEQGTTALAGLTVDWLWIDEPPPPDVYGEAMSRVAVRGGPVWMTLTPIGRPVEWLRDHIEGDPDRGLEPSEDWEQHVIRLTPSDCPHRSPESIEAQIASYLPSELPQRRDGAWEGIETDRAYECWDPDSHVQSYHIDDLGYVHLGLGIDHGERAGRETALLVLWSQDHIWIYDEYVSTQPTDPDQDAQAIRAMLESHGLAPSNLDEVYGDINTAGKSRIGRTVNDELGAALGVNISRASKKKLIDHIRPINIALRQGRITVHPRCRTLIKSLSQWKAEPRYDDIKHIIDALHYILTPFLGRMKGPQVGKLEVRR